MEKTNGTLERTMASAVGNSHHIITQHHCRGYFCPRDNVFSCTIQIFMDTHEIMSLKNFVRVMIKDEIEHQY